MFTSVKVIFSVTLVLGDGAGDATDVSCVWTIVGRTRRSDVAERARRIMLRGCVTAGGFC
jgi:hypothetical protein